jgi:hypothetical protein
MVISLLKLKQTAKVRHMSMTGPGEPTQDSSSPSPFLPPEEQCHEPKPNFVFAEPTFIEPDRNRPIPSRHYFVVQ